MRKNKKVAQSELDKIKVFSELVHAVEAARAAGDTAEEKRLLRDADQHQDYIITSVKKDGKRAYDFTMDSGWSFRISDTDIVPKEGDTVRLYGKGMGYTVRGVEINGEEVFYRTEHEQDILHQKQVEDSRREQREEFEANKDQYFADIAALPEVFQARFKKYAKNNPDFDWEFGGYELFTCKQAVVFADALKTVEALDKFYKAPWKKQKKMVPGMDEGHSGNTFGGAVYLAKLFIMDTLLVEQAHGALAPMVGCTEYGCHTDQDFVEGKDQSDGDNGETVHEGTDQGTDQG